MNREELQKEALNNILALSRNVYPGRGIICGLDETGLYFVQVGWIMGRSTDSRNRVYVEESNGMVKTAAADPAIPVKNPELTLYPAMMESDGIFVVSNGHQTSDALKELRTSDSLRLEDWTYEPDKPNFTPRITAGHRTFGGKFSYRLSMSVIYKDPISKDRLSHFYDFPLPEKGSGLCVTTYKGDGDPLPSFEGEPYLLPLLGDMKSLAEGIWKNLNEDNRVAIVVKFIDIETGQSHIHIINKYKQVAG